MFRTAGRSLRRSALKGTFQAGPALPRAQRLPPSITSSILVAPRSAGNASAFSSSSYRLSEAGQTGKADVPKAEEAERKPEAEALGVDGEKAEGEGAGEATDGKAEFEKTLKEKDARIKELQDSLLYAKADMQNLQRRSEQEKAQTRDFAITKLAKDLTSSLDILALALRSVPEELRSPVPDLQATDPRRAVAELYSGVDLTSKSLIDMLRTHGIVQFDPTGEKFDPAQHEALYQAPVPGKEPGTVLECSKAGYKIKDRILRAAQVGVVQESS